MRMGSRTPPGELIYLSERKLLHLATLRGASNGWTKQEERLRAQGPLTGADAAQHSAPGRLARRQPDPERRRREIDSLLPRLVWAMAERHGLAALDEGALGIGDGSWFHFRRTLRIGVGATDETRPSRALVLVDRDPVATDGLLPSLLMHGSPRNLRTPWRDQDLVTQAGSRGPGAGKLFRRAAEVEMARETEIEAHLPTLVDRLYEGRDERGSSEELASMYETCASEDWAGALPLPQLAGGQLCEGIAHTSLLAAGHGRTIVMATPLYVRIAPAGGEPSEIERMLRRGRGVRGLLRRLRG